MTVKGVSDSKQIKIPNCFMVTDSDEEWTICEKDQASADKWVASIYQVLGIVVPPAGAAPT